MSTSTTNGVWLPMPAAAAAMGVSTRTLSRRVAAGEVDVTDLSGRKMVRMPDELTGAEDASADHDGSNGSHERPAPTVAELTKVIAPATAQELADVSDARVGDAKDETRRARTNARRAWSVSAAVVVLLAVVALWSTRTVGVLGGRIDAEEGRAAMLGSLLDRSQSEVEQLNAKVGELDGSRHDLMARVEHLVAKVEKSERRQLEFWEKLLGPATVSAQP